jgi:hypothetical protein
MIWPHRQAFPRRREILVVGCLSALLVASLWPGLSLEERALMPVFVAYGIASGFFTYGLLLMLLRFVPHLHNLIALTLFYGALVSLGLLLVQTAALSIGPRSYSPYGLALSVAIGVPGCLGVAAAAFSALNRDASPSNQRLERP